MRTLQQYIKIFMGKYEEIACSIHQVTATRSSTISHQQRVFRNIASWQGVAFRARLWRPGFVQGVLESSTQRVKDGNWPNGRLGNLTGPPRPVALPMIRPIQIFLYNQPVRPLCCTGNLLYFWIVLGLTGCAARLNPTWVVLEIGRNTNRHLGGSCGY